MKKFKVLSIITAIVIIVGMVILSSCSTPSEDSSSSQEGKNEVSNQASINELLLSVGRGSKVVQVAGGVCYSMAIVRDSRGNQTLWVIGENSDGQLGLGNTNAQTTWKNTGLKNVTLVACGNSHALCISNNYLYVAGENQAGQLGLGYQCHYVNKWTKTVYGNISALAAGNRHSMFVSWGCLWIAGDNQHGQLGFDPSAYPFFTVWTKTQTNAVTEIACGSSHSMYIGNNKTSLYVTGRNDYGQLGLGSVYNVHTWTKVTNINATSLEYIACGDTHSLLVAYGPLISNPNLKSRWIWVTGGNMKGQIGLPPSTEKINIWKQQPYGLIESIACGAIFSMFTSGGNLWVTGYNAFGQLGLGDQTDRYGWEQTKYGNIQGKIAAGEMHSLFISQNNTWAAGSNIFGELGVPSFKKDRSVWFLKN